MSKNYDTEKIRNLFYQIYNNDPSNLKIVAKKLLEEGLGYMDILQLTMRELKLGLGEAIMQLEIPDYVGWVLTFQLAQICSLAKCVAYLTNHLNTLPTKGDD